MPWVVGIDEAGYGPNLGPLVQAAVALYLPDGDPAGWETLKPVVRRCGEKADGRLLIDDSKKVYTRGGLAALERGVWSIAPSDRRPFVTSSGVARSARRGVKTCAAKRGSMATTRFPSRSSPFEAMGCVETVRAAIGTRRQRSLSHRPVQPHC